MKRKLYSYFSKEIVLIKKKLMQNKIFSKKIFFPFLPSIRVYVRLIHFEHSDHEIEK